MSLGSNLGFLLLFISAGGGRSSVDAWFSSALDIEECLSGGVDSDVHLFVADVVKSFDTVDRGVLDRVLSSLGLPAWFRHAYFQYHAGVRLRFKLAVGLALSGVLDSGWIRDVPQGCPKQLLDFQNLMMILLLLSICLGVAIWIG